MQNLGADIVIKAFNAVSTSAPSSTGPDGSLLASVSASATAIDAGSSSESVLGPTSIGSVAHTVPNSRSIESSSSQSAIESLPTPSSDFSSAPTSGTSPASVTEVESISTSVMAPIESRPAPSSSSSSVIESASPTNVIAESPPTQSSRPARTRCQ